MPYYKSKSIIVFIFYLTPYSIAGAIKRTGATRRAFCYSILGENFKNSPLTIFLVCAQNKKNWLTYGHRIAPLLFMAQSIVEWTVYLPDAIVSKGFCRVVLAITFTLGTLATCRCGMKSQNHSSSFFKCVWKIAEN